MLKRLRRTNTRDRESSISTITSQVIPSRASFLGLPSELRNAIYEHLAADTTLMLASTLKKRKKLQPVGLLLVSKQLAREYRPILLVNANLCARVPRLDFGNVIAGLEAISQDTLELLALNKHLTILLVIAHVPEKAELEALSAWLLYRSAPQALRPEEAGSTLQRTDSATASPKLPAGADTLYFHYNVIIKPSLITSGGLADPVNMRVALLSSLLRQVPKLGSREILGEKKRMILDLARRRDELLGLERRSAAEEESRPELVRAENDALENIRRSYLPMQLR